MYRAAFTRRNSGVCIRKDLDQELDISAGHGVKVRDRKNAVANSDRIRGKCMNEYLIFYTFIYEQKQMLRKLWKIP